VDGDGVERAKALTDEPVDKGRSLGWRHGVDRWLVGGWQLDQAGDVRVDEASDDGPPQCCLEDGSQVANGMRREGLGFALKEALDVLVGEAIEAEGARGRGSGGG
jgi:hypothetical protein